MRATQKGFSNENGRFAGGYPLRRAVHGRWMGRIFFHARVNLQCGLGNALTTERGENLLSSSHIRKVDVRFPSFETEYKIDFIDALKALGCRRHSLFWRISH